MSPSLKPNPFLLPKPPGFGAIEGIVGSDLAKVGAFGLCKPRGIAPGLCICAGSPPIGPRGEGVLGVGGPDEFDCEDIELPWRDKAKAFILALRSSGKRPLDVGGGATGRLALESTPR